MSSLQVLLYQMRPIPGKIMDYSLESCLLKDLNSYRYFRFNLFLRFRIKSTDFLYFYNYQKAILWLDKKIPFCLGSSFFSADLFGIITAPKCFNLASFSLLIYQFLYIGWEATLFFCSGQSLDIIEDSLMPFVLLFHSSFLSFLYFFYIFYFLSCSQNVCCSLQKVKSPFSSYQYFITLNFIIQEFIQMKKQQIIKFTYENRLKSTSAHHRRKVRIKISQFILGLSFISKAFDSSFSQTLFAFFILRFLGLIIYLLYFQYLSKSSGNYITSFISTFESKPRRTTSSSQNRYNFIISCSQKVDQLSMQDSPMIY